MASNKQRGLGRDLEYLLGKGRVSAIKDALAPTTTTIQTPATLAPDEILRNVALDMLQPGRYQPRQMIEPEALEELASSIRAQGVIQPIVVRPISDRKYEIIAGERRWRAAQLAGLKEISAIIRPLSDEAASAVALIENIQREDLNPLEQALAYHRLIDEFGLTHQAVADFVGKSRAAVTNLLRLLQLQNEVKRFVENGDLEMGHARALLSLEASQQIEMARQVVAKGLSVRETESLIRRLQKPNVEPQVKTVAQQPDRDIRHLQDNLSEKLGARVEIKHHTKGHGKLTIEYTTLDELQGILEHIK